MSERVDPATNADEVTTLVEFLDYFRATLLMKVEELSDEQARTPSCPPSPLNLLGLVRHMAEVERFWFREVLIGESEDTAPPMFSTDDEPDLDMFPPEGSTLADAVAAFDAEIVVVRAVIAGMSLDQTAVVARHGEHCSLRWILVHMVEEYARHCGHADLLREAIDGETGD